MTKAEKLKAEKKALEKLAATAEQLKQDFAELFHVEQYEPETNPVDEDIQRRAWTIEYHAKNLTNEIIILKKLAE